MLLTGVVEGIWRIVDVMRDLVDDQRLMWLFAVSDAVSLGSHQV